MAQEYQYFYEDEVYRFNKKGNLELGMVLENAEFVSSDEESDGDEEDKVTKGSIRVAWYPKGEEQVLPERKVGLADRSLMPGDVVRRLIRGKDTQRGYCRQVHVTSSVQVVGTNLVILNVDSNDLTPLEEFTTDIAVALDSWVGMVHMVKCRLVMVCGDGSRCIMSDGEALELDDLRDTRDRVRLDSEFRRYDFYPGQQLVGCVANFELAEWVHCTKEMETTLGKPRKNIKVTVEQVQVVQLGVRWQCRAFSNDPNVDKEQPKYLVQGEDLKRVKMLNVFEPCTLQLGDRNYYSSKEGDVIMTREQWRRLMAAQLSADHTNPCPLRPRPPKNKSTDGRLVSDMDGQMARWAEYFGQLFTVDPPIGQLLITGLQAVDADPPIDVTAPSLDEVREAVAKLRGGKAAGVCNISAELLKAGGKGDRQDCNNYFGITLLSVSGKVLAHLLMTRIRSHVLKHQRPRQSGFTPGKSTTDRILELCVLVERRCEFRQGMLAAYVDLKKAFDSVHRESLWDLLRLRGIPASTIGLYSGTESAVKCWGGVSSFFPVNTGVRQGCVLAPSLFNTCMDWVLGKVVYQSDCGASLGNTKITDLVFADDAVIFAESLEVLVMALEALARRQSLWDLRSPGIRPRSFRCSFPTNEDTDVVAVKDAQGADGGTGLEHIKQGGGCNDSDGFIDVDTDDCSDTASISSGASTGSTGRRNKKGPALMTKMMKKRKLKRAKRKVPSDAASVKPGDQLVVETLMTTSKADVVWQDGTLEKAILSTVLYPIHHLDDQEFFPGDFVVEQKDSIDPHEYGVVQKVDHGGRTSIVKWFRTYTAGKDPQPQLLSQQEMSVYDLRDHPDFRYRPGSVVIRVANFEEKQNCFTGQVLDNFPTGEVSVWWVDGQKSVCYPQDLYKVGEYDSDEGELWDDTASDESWETESEHSVIAEESESESEGLLKTRLVANIEKARIAMSRLEEIFTQNPALQTTAVMKQLLDCYKECRYMDKLMGTSFFHESNFQGLIEKVRERGRASTTQRMTEQINRLFSTSDAEAGLLSPQLNSGEETKSELGKSDKSDVPKSNKCNKSSKECEDSANTETDILSSKDAILNSSTTLSENLANLSMSQSKASKPEKTLEGGRNRGGELRHKRMSETDMTLHDKSYSDSRLKDSKSCNDLKVSCDSGVTEEIRTSHMCAQLCSLMKAQLLKTYEEVVFRFGGHFDMSLMLMPVFDAPGPHLPQEEERPMLDEERVLLAEERMVVEWNNMHGDNKENIPMFEDLVNENTSAANSVEVPSQDVSVVPAEVEVEVEAEAEAGAVVSEGVSVKVQEQSEETPSPSFVSPTAASPVTNGSITTSNGNESETTNRNTSVEDSTNDDLIDAIIANAVAAVNGEVSASVMKMCPEAVVSPTEGFQVLEAAPDSHKFKLTMFQPTDPQHFYRTVRKEMKLLSTSLPPGIWVRGYEDRMDLYSVMIRGPERTPYEDGLFFFDFQLSADYPRAPPLCHYVTYCSDKLNPNLYEDGKVCVSLLGTWSGKGTEVWTSQSNLLQVIISIQGLILVSEPYFNEAGYERQKGTQQGRENSRMYNEMVVLKLIQAMAKVIQAPPDIFRNEIIHHFHIKAASLPRCPYLSCFQTSAEIRVLAGNLGELQHLAPTVAHNTYHFQGDTQPR
ncbi:(E3-independent) E2 ubiquitin-conjugating enzyme UBE2O [Chionoecetes opilio]|uniref:(E3-independent) E2 ubiquitin-conjugating enzyme UBE2O n=1 Tax=Chionoecetes opilio TaxID=41210 RepID=A0A8J4Z192_CHIOP|nr:(E3-independent) E2 ubiquitin-conjugating enzyme UBE2O [Chionoecetes opilio]